MNIFSISCVVLMCLTSLCQASQGDVTSGKSNYECKGSITLHTEDGPAVKISTSDADSDGIYKLAKKLYVEEANIEGTCCFRLYGGRKRKPRLTEVFTSDKMEVFTKIHKIEILESCSGILTAGTMALVGGIAAGLILLAFVALMVYRKLRTRNQADTSTRYDSVFTD